MASAVVGTLRAILSLDSAEFESGIRKTSSELNKWSVDARKMGQQATTLGTQLTKTLTLPLVALGAGAGKMAIDFESAFAGVKKTVDATEPEFEAMAGAFRKLSKEIPISVTELAKLGETAGAMGIPKESIVDFSKTMALMAVTTDLSAEQAATSMASIQAIFGAAGKDTDRLASTIVALGNAGNSTEVQIVEMGQRIAGAAHQVGISQAEVVSFASTLAGLGINAEAGGSAISRIFLKMNDAVMDGGAALAEFARVAGVSSAQFREAFETNAANATVMFIKGLGRLKEEGENTNQTMEGMIGKNIILKSTLNALSGSGDMLSETLKVGNKAWSDNTALTVEAQKRFETTEAQLTLLWNRIKDVGITIGNALLPIIRDLVSGMSDLVPYLESAAKWFGGLPKPVQLFAVGLLGVGAALGPLLVVFGQLALAASQLGIAFTAGGIGATALGTALKLLPGLIAVLGTAWVAVKIGTWIGEVTGLTNAIQRLAEWFTGAKDASIPLEQQQKAIALASKLAGREIANYADAMKFLETRASGLRAEHEKGKQAEADAAEQTKKSAAARQRQTEITEEAAKAQKAYNDSVDALAKKLTGADLADEVKKLADGVKRAGGAAKLSEYEFEELGKQLLEMERKGAKLPPTLADIARKARQAEFDAKILTDAVIKGGREAEIARPKWLTLGEAFTESKVKAIDLGEAFKMLGAKSIEHLNPPPIDPWQKWRDAAFDFTNGVTDSIARGFVDSIGHASSFGTHMKEVWQGIKNSFLNVLDSMLASFINNFIKGLTDSIGSAKLGETVGNNLKSFGKSMLGGLTSLMNLGIVGMFAAAIPLVVAGIKKLAGLFKGEGAKTNDARDEWMTGLGGLGGAHGLIVQSGNDAQLQAAFEAAYHASNRDIFNANRDAFNARAAELGLPGFKTGTGGWMDFGAGTMAMLNGIEAVVPKPAGGDLSGALGGGTMTIVLERDGRKEAEFLVPFIPDVVRRYKLA